MVYKWSIINENEIIMKLTTITHVLLFILFAVSANAQIKFGFKAGYTHYFTTEETSVAGADNRNLTHEVSFEKMSPAKSLGLFVQSFNGPLFIQSEGLFSSHTTSYRVESYIDDINDGFMAEENIQNLDMNVMAGFRFKNFRIGGGPKFHLLLDATSNFNQLDFYVEKRKSFTQGFQALVGYDFKNFHIDLKYENEFSKAGDHIYFQDEKAAFGSKVRGLNVSAGFGF